MFSNDKKSKFAFLFFSDYCKVIVIYNYFIREGKAGI